MKVFIVASWYPTPKNPLIVPFITEQAAALSDYGCDVTVLSAELVSLRSGEKAGLNKRIENGVEIYQFILPIYRLGSMEFSASLTTFLVKKLFDKAVRDKGVPDIVHIHSFRFAGYGAVQKAREYKVPCVLTEHYSAIESNTLTQTEKKYLALTKPDKTVAVSVPLAEKLQTYGIDSAVIPNFVDTDLFEYEPIPHEKFTFVTCCWLSKRKAIDVLIKAFAEVADCCLNIIGGGPELENLKNLTEELGLSQRVCFIPETSHEMLGERLNECDCFVLPSRAETFGVVYIEAMACGLPVIATRCGGPEHIVDDSNGILVDIDDIDGIVKAMQMIKDGAISYDRRQIRQNCVEKYGKTNIVEKLISVYNNMIG